MSPFQNFIILPQVIAMDVEFTLTQPEVQKILSSSSETFDVVIAEIFQADALFGEFKILKIFFFYENCLSILFIICLICFWGLFFQ